MDNGRVSSLFQIDHWMRSSTAAAANKIIISIYCSIPCTVQWFTIQFLQMFCGFGNCKSNKPHQTNVHLFAYFATRRPHRRHETNNGMRKCVHTRFEQTEFRCGMIFCAGETAKKEINRRHDDGKGYEWAPSHWINIKCAVTAPITRDALQPRASNRHMKRVNSTNYLFYYFHSAFGSYVAARVQVLISF